MDERIKKAIDFAADVTKQIITLAAGIVAITITFSKDFVVNVPDSAKPWLFGAWILYIVSIASGIWTLMALTGTLETTNQQSATPSIRGRNITLPSITQIGSFAPA